LAGRIARRSAESELRLIMANDAQRIRQVLAED